MRPSLLGYAWVVAFAASCDDPALVPRDVSRPAVFADVRDAAIPRTATDTGPPPVDASRARRAVPTIDRVVALDSRRVIALGGSRLYRLTGDHWTRVAIEGAEPRDIGVARGAMWILAKGTGTNAGRTLVIRTTTGGDLTPVASPSIASSHEPRALAVIREGQFYIGGENPSLVRLYGPELIPVSVPDEPVQGLEYFDDDLLLVTRSRTRVTVLQFGVANSVDLDDYLDTVMDPDGHAHVVHLHGEFSAGRPGREIEGITTTSPIEPRVAAILANHRPAIAGAGGPFASWARGAWQVIEGAFPEDPIAILPTQPPLVIGRNGEVVAVDGTSVESVVAAGTL